MKTLIISTVIIGATLTSCVKINSEKGEITVFKKGNLEQLKIDKNSGGDVYLK